MLWLEPLTYQQMREMMDKAKEMREKAAAQMGSKPGAEQPSGRPSTGGKPSSEKENKKPSWSSGQRLRRIYLRSGRFPAAKSENQPGRRPGQERPQIESFASGSMVWLERPDSTIEGIEVKQRGPETRAEYAADDGGWYRIFAYNDLGVQDKSLVRLFSYYTFMSHGDKADEKEPELIEREGYYEGSPELELVFVYDDGKRRYRENVGNKIRVRALFRGEPVVKGRMALITEQGWRQMQTTDDNGEAQFTLIKEDFHDDGVDRSKSELYLLQLKHQVESSGVHQGESYENEHYIATLPFRVSPALSDWQSKYMAYLAAIITIIGAAVAIAIRRRRKREQ
jgi:hypothetical protein